MLFNLRIHKEKCVIMHESMANDRSITFMYHESKYVSYL